MSPAEIELHLAFQSIIPPNPVTLEYRLYYDELGDINSCSMQQHADGNYLVVTKEEYDRYFDYNVVNGKIKKIDKDAGFTVQLRKAKNGIAVAYGHAGLILEQEQYNNIEYYEYRSKV